MKMLLDTHAFLWMVSDDPRLSSAAKEAIQNSGNALYLSVVSWWEIGLKISIGKLDLHSRWSAIFKKEMQLNAIQWLAINPEHCERVAILPFLHRDPFDRMLVAQAQQEKMTILSTDENLRHYAVKVLW